MEHCLDLPCYDIRVCMGQCTSQHPGARKNRMAGRNNAVGVDDLDHNRTRDDNILGNQAVGRRAQARDSI